jgi:hypothetical protein
VGRTRERKGRERDEVRTVSMVVARREPSSKKVRRIQESQNTEQSRSDRGRGARYTNQSARDTPGTGLGFRIAGMAANFGGAVGLSMLVLLHISIAVPFNFVHSTLSPKLLFLR